MRVFMVLLVLGMLVSGVLLNGQQAYAQQYPQVAGLTPFSPEANYMSLAGYLRWQVFAEQGRWISRSEAEQVVASQPATPVTASAVPSDTGMTSEEVAMSPSPAVPDTSIQMETSALPPPSGSSTYVCPPQ